jgi:hypothetical protein
MLHCLVLRHQPFLIQIPSPHPLLPQLAHLQDPTFASDTAVLYRDIVKPKPTLQLNAHVKDIGGLTTGGH